MHAHRFSWLALFGAGLMLIASAASADSCSNILKEGVFDQTSISSDTRAMTSFLDYYARTKWKDRESREARKTEGGVGYGPFSLSGGQAVSSSEIHKSFDDLTTLSEGSFFLSNRTEQHARIASQAILNAWNTCMQQTGLKLSIRRSSDPSQIFIILNFVADGSEDPKLNAVKNKSPAVTCDDVPGAIIKAGPNMTITCKRTTNKSVTLNVDVSRKLPGDGQFVDWPSLTRRKIVTGYVLRVISARGPLQAIAASRTSAIVAGSPILDPPAPGKEIDISDVVRSLPSFAKPVSIIGQEIPGRPDTGDWLIEWEILEVDDFRPTNASF